MISFGRFSLNEDTQRLSCGDREIPLRAKSLAVLRELVHRRGRLVTKEELFGVCWRNTAVSQTVLRVCIAEIRAVLASDVTGSTSIESVGRRGYRLVLDGHEPDQSVGPPLGRERELAALRRALGRAHRGQRQSAFVTGEAGLGKTTLLEHFVEETRTTSRTRVGWGQCVELTAGTEPYLPILDLLGRLGADDSSGAIVAALERWAPSWLLHMPGLVDATRADAVARRVLHPNRDRMLRELAEALEALSADETLVVVIEDLHWSDLASADVLAYLSQRSTPARLLVIGSYRPADLASGDGSLQSIKQGLVASRGAMEIPLPPLTRSDVEAYLARRFNGSPVDRDLGRRLHTRTKGNPLFVTATVDYLLDRGILSASPGRWQVAEPLEGVVPDGLRQLALRQLDPLDSIQRRVLDAASVVGSDFTVASVAAATGGDVLAVEDVCTRLVSRHELISPTGVASWPDGTVSGQYEFRHVIYREVLAGALSPARAQVLHRTVGERLETAWGERSAEIAAELAVHFAAAGDEERAIRYHIAAGKRARLRFAEREAVVHLRGALERLRNRPLTPERVGAELSCLMDLGSALIGVHGAASGAALDAFTRALELAEKLQVAQARFGAQTAIYSCLALRANLPRARAVAEDLLASAEESGNPVFKIAGHVSLGFTLFHLAEFAAAQPHFAEAHALWRPEFPPFAFDPSILARGMLGFCALLFGKPDVAADWMQNSVARAEEIKTPYNLSYAYQLSAQYYATAGQRELALEHATKALAVATEYGYVTHEIVAAIVSAWARREVDVMRQGIARYEGAEQYAATSLFRALLIETLLDLNDVATVPGELARVFAFVERSGERRHLPELYRLEGEYLRRGAAGANDSSRARAKTCFDKALVLAREQGTRLWELRAAIAKTELLASEGAQREARDLIGGCVRSFVGGTELPDLRRAHAVLAALDAPQDLLRGLGD